MKRWAIILAGLWLAGCSLSPGQIRKLLEEEPPTTAALQAALTLAEELLPVATETATPAPTASATPTATETATPAPSASPVVDPDDPGALTLAATAAQGFGFLAPPLGCLFSEDGADCVAFCQDASHEPECLSAQQFVEAQYIDLSAFLRCMDGQRQPAGDVIDQCLLAGFIEYHRP